MLEAFGGNVKRSRTLRFTTESVNAPRQSCVRIVSKQGEPAMGDTGKKDKGKKEKQKKAQRSPKEKRKDKREKKRNQ